MTDADAGRSLEGKGGNTIRVVAPGPLSLVQDGGRAGFQNLGVSVSGAADINALNTGNRLVGNDPDAAALEILLGGAEFVFEHTVIFALTGAETGATLDGVPLALNVSYAAHAGAQLVFGMATRGLRAYLAVAGGIDTPPVLGSRSTHVASEIGGIEGRALVAGDALHIGEPPEAAISGNVFPGPGSGDPGTDSASQDSPGPPTVNVRVVLGPQDDEFSPEGIEVFLNSMYVVTDQSNRQGLRLDGPEIESSTGRYDIVSDAVVSGSVQVPGDGKPIILLADRQTTGGYAKVATVASVDLPKLGQAAPGTSITFAAISVEEAQELLVARSKRVLDSDLGQLVDAISVRVDDQQVSVGVAENETADPARGDQIARITRVARINGITYPIFAETYTPGE